MAPEQALARPVGDRLTTWPPINVGKSSPVLAKTSSGWPSIGPCACLRR